MKKVLIVDDEVSVRAFVKRVLAKDYSVVEAGNGEEAVNIAHTAKPDIILMDIMMPETDGLSACHTIKESYATRKIPIIMLTGVGYDLNRKLSIEIMGADDYMTKPFSIDELKEMVARHLK